MMLEAILRLIGVSIGIAVIAAYIFFKIYSENIKKQARDKIGNSYKAFASKNKLKYSEFERILDDDCSFYSNDLIRMRNLGHTPSVEYNVFASNGDIEYKWGIYHYVTTEEKYRRFASSVEIHHYVNYCYFICSNMKLPYFYIRKRNFLDFINKLAETNKEIEINCDKNFKKNFAVYGNDEEDIKSIFNEEICGLLNKLKGNDYTIEGCNDSLVIIGGKGDIDERVYIKDLALKITKELIEVSPRTGI